MSLSSGLSPVLRSLNVSMNLILKTALLGTSSSYPWHVVFWIFRHCSSDSYILDANFHLLCVTNIFFCHLSQAATYLKLCKSKAKQNKGDYGHLFACVVLFSPPPQHFIEEKKNHLSHLYRVFLLWNGNCRANGNIFQPKKPTGAKLQELFRLSWTAWDGEEECVKKEN